MTDSNNYCVIMAGGIGSRFWPFSKSSLPKQFLDLFGTGHSLIQQTFDRYKKIIPVENIFVSTNTEYKDLVIEHLPSVDPSHIITEPVRRNTAPSIALASYKIKDINPDATVIITPIDHLIIKEDRFIEAINKGLDFVSGSPRLLTLGIKPNRPETGYGYIQTTDNIEGNFFKVKTFIEKPQLEFAKVFIESDEFNWNSGIFLWKNSTILDAFEKYMPDMCHKIMKGIDEYASCPNISIDYGIMEKADNVYVELCDFGWADLGSWDSLYEISPKDENKNVSINGGCLFYNSKENIIAIKDNAITVIKDLEGYIVASSNNNLLICKRDDSEAIRKFLNDIKIKLGNSYI